MTSSDASSPSQFDHVPVLPKTVLDTLAPQVGETYVDLTAGLGGHACEIAPHLGPSGTIVLVDLDESNLSRAAQRVQARAIAPHIETIRGNFADAPRELEKRGIVADMVLADLGFSSSQMDDPSRGMSFRADGPLDMRLDRSIPVTARDLVMTMDDRELARIFKQFGEEPGAGQIARAIVEHRKHTPIETTHQLAAVVRDALKSSRKGAKPGIDPATRVFQALRIAVNDELGSLERLLKSIERAAEIRAAGPHNPHSRPAIQTAQTDPWLAAGARVGIISFHSLEDRPVKRSMRALVEADHASWINQQLLRPDEEEVAANPRSRSAKLRAVRLRG
ncbi:MAG: 16S rRNA (cytosine(1402)-N(4))-methyltransferase RsmH [Phycisphaeraceae bacterium]|nr:16S rRNA (cytosine(1402)-N(4))-methyltransferase RsmH [Phycisphaerales bacterium]MCB9859189.1 16S rRNA (cytosine(1402)-N(4))-methyltransferase RsmH [Phycisphaeraceae bacterium]